MCSEIKEDKECLTSSQSAVGVDGDKASFSSHSLFHEAGEACCWSRSARKCSVKSKDHVVCFFFLLFFFGFWTDFIRKAFKRAIQEGQSPCAVAKRVLVAVGPQVFVFF